MDQKQIDVFLAVMRAGSVTSAAQRLHMSQPSVSKLIALSERRLGFRLFERVKGRLVPTPEASLVFDEALRIQENLGRFERFLVNVRQYKVGQLRVAATPALALTMLPLAARQFRAMHSAYGLVLDMMLNHEISEAVERQQYDVGLAVVPKSDVSGDLDVIAKGRIICVVPRAHRLSRSRRVEWSQLDPAELIYITTDTRIVDSMRARIPDFDSRPSSAIESNRYTIAVNLVKQGLGITLVDDFTLIGMDRSGLAVCEFAPSIEVSLVAMVGKRNAVKRSALDFVQVLRDVAAAAQERR